MVDNLRYSGYFKTEFENRCICLIIEAYKMALYERTIEIDWDEDDITAELNRYVNICPEGKEWRIRANDQQPLHNNSIVKTKGYAAKRSRIDLRFVNWSLPDELVHYMEAKLLKGKDKGLCRRYISTGIDNFISGKYENGFLAGYLMEGRIDEAVERINSLIIEYKREPETLHKTPHTACNDYYGSNHSSLGVLKHIILDFTR